MNAPSNHSSQSPTWAFWLTGASLILIASTLLRFLPPDQIVVPWFDLALPQSCWSRQVLGINCPGCGLTRCFVLASHGQWSEAFQAHPPGLVLYFAVVLQIPLRLLQAISPPNSRSARLVTQCLSVRIWGTFGAGIAAASAINWLVR